MKNLILILSIPLLFSSCQTCKECKPDEVEQVIVGYEEVQTGTSAGEWLGFDEDGNSIWSDGDPIYETQPIYSTPIKVSLEICRDNFDSKSDYNTYIGDMENSGYSCVSDFWN